ncbi:MAG: LysM peptidoglycan-binding domain-containing protein [Litorimonas sp.]
MRRLFAAMLLSSVAATAIAQDREIVVQPAPDVLSTIDAPIEYDENGVMKAQYLKAEDLTPEQLSALLAEADKVRNYRRAMNRDVPSEAVVQHRSTTVSGTSQHKSHIVASGDTLFNIAKRYGIGVTDIQRANGISGSSISLGQTLAIPAAPQARPVANLGVPVTDGVVTRRIVEPLPGDGQIQDAGDSTTQIYAVLPKDTLFAISRRTCVPVTDLIAANGLENANVLKPGQRLSLPDGHCLAR